MVTLLVSLPILFNDLLPSLSCDGKSVLVVGVGVEVMISGSFVGPFGDEEVDAVRSLVCFWNLKRNAGAIVRPAKIVYVSSDTSPRPMIDFNRVFNCL